MDTDMQRLTAERDAYKMLAEGRAKLLVAYRLGTNRSPEAAFKLIERAEAKLNALGIEVR